MINYAIFSDKQGCGYIADNPVEMLHEINPLSVTINNKRINPGELTNLFDHFSRELEYLGLKGDNEMIFVMGKIEDLFEKWYYYQAVFKIAENRIFEMFSPEAGRDFYFINGGWK